MIFHVSRSIGRKLMLAVGVPSLVFALLGVLWLRHQTWLAAPGLEAVYRAREMSFLVELGRTLARADRGAALKVAEQLRVSVERAAIPHGTSEAGRVTISVGVAVFPDDGQDLGALADAADSAFFAAKRAGRNSARAHEAGMRAHPDRRRDVKLTADADADAAEG